MAKKSDPIAVYLEIGQTRAFAGALDWPGWCRAGRDEASSLQALIDYGPRYARVLQKTKLGFRPPSEISALTVVERVDGNAATNFGVPNLALPSDLRPVDPADLKRWQQLLEAIWQAFDTAVQAAAGRNLRTGPRGGGRDLDKLIEHVRAASAGYLTSLGGNLQPDAKHDPVKAYDQVRKAILTALPSAARGELPTRGPRGGIRWTPRYFVRRLAWHDLDHLWELEDRAGL